MVLKKLSNLAVVGISVTLLSACSASPDQVVGKASNKANEMVTQLETIQNNEAALQKAFEADIATDESLANLGEKGEGETRKNLTSRQDALDELSSLYTTFQENTASLQEFDESDFTAEEDFNAFNEMRELSLTVDEQMGTYIENYQTVLTVENDYYNSLTAEDSDLTVFTEGIEEINNQFKSSQELLAQLLPNLTSLAKNTDA